MMPGISCESATTYRQPQGREINEMHLTNLRCYTGQGRKHNEMHEMEVLSGEQGGPAERNM